MAVSDHLLQNMFSPNYLVDHLGSIGQLNPFVRDRHVCDLHNGKAGPRSYIDLE